MKKKVKSHVISVRYTEDEYLDVLMKIADENGELIMTPGTFSKVATLGGRVTVVDSEVEQYKVFVAAKASNNINQIAKRLNIDNKAKKITSNTYLQVLDELKNIKDQLDDLLKPVS